MKPTSWTDAPVVVLEHVLWNYIDLEYHGSKAEAIHDLLNSLDGGRMDFLGHATTVYRIASYWNSLTEESFQRILTRIRDDLRNQIEVVETYMT